MSYINHDHPIPFCTASLTELDSGDYHRTSRRHPLKTRWSSSQPARACAGSICSSAAMVLPDDLLMLLRGGPPRFISVPVDVHPALLREGALLCMDACVSCSYMQTRNIETSTNNCRFLIGLVVMTPACHAGSPGSIPGWEVHISFSPSIQFCSLCSAGNAKESNIAPERLLGQPARLG